MHACSILEFANHRLRELCRKGFGLALGKIDENIGDIVGFGRQVHPGDHVGFVFRLGQPRRFRIGSMLRQRIDSRPFGLPLTAWQSIGVNRNEQRRAARTSKTDSLGELE